MKDNEDIVVTVEGMTASISKELANDLKVVHGIDAVEELTQVLKKDAELNREIEKERTNGLG